MQQVSARVPGLANSAHCVLSLIFYAEQYVSLVMPCFIKGNLLFRATHEVEYGLLFILAKISVSIITKCGQTRAPLYLCLLEGIAVPQDEQLAGHGQ